MCFFFRFLWSTGHVFDGFNVSLSIVPTHVYSSIAIAGEYVDRTKIAEQRTTGIYRDTAEAEDEQTGNLNDRR